MFGWVLKVEIVQRMSLKPGVREEELVSRERNSHSSDSLSDPPVRETRAETRIGETRHLDKTA